MVREKTMTQVFHAAKIYIYKVISKDDYFLHPGIIHKSTSNFIYQNMIETYYTKNNISCIKYNMIEKIRVRRYQIGSWVAQ